MVAVPMTLLPVYSVCGGAAEVSARRNQGLLFVLQAQATAVIISILSGLTVIRWILPLNQGGPSIP